MTYTRFSYTQLRNLQLLQYAMLSDVARICRKYDITYFLICGTLLGAVRHEGFIPWDYDIDIAMTRAELNRFLAHAQELSEPFYLEHICYADIDHAGLTRVQRSDHPEFGTIHIDIFVMDYAKTGWIETSAGMSLCKFLHILKLSRREKQILSERFKGEKAKAFVLLMARFWGLFFRSSFVEKVIYKLRVSVVETDKLLVLEASATFPTEWFKDTVFLKFEDGMYPCPIEYEDFLTGLYGDYMEIPPEGKRYLQETVTQ